MHTYADIHTHASCSVVWESLRVAHNNPSQCPAVPESVQSSSGHQNYTWSEPVFGYCIDVEISRKNFHEGTSLVYGDYQFMGCFFLLMQQETMCFLPCQIYLLYSLVELLLFMIFQICLASEARILTLA